MLKQRKSQEELRKEDTAAERVRVRKIHPHLAVLLLCLGLAALTGCQAAEEESEELVVVEQEEESVPYNLALVTRGDISLTQTVRGVYEELEGEDISFAVSGRIVSNVYVEEGDRVSRGQLLADLGDDDLDAQIRTLEYQISRNRILLEQTQASEDYEISSLWLQYFYQTDMGEGAGENLERGIAQVQQRYEYLREDYQDAIDMDLLRLERAEDQRKTNKVYAGMDGIVTWVRPELEDSTSQKGETIIQLVDDSVSLFTVEGTEYASLFAEGEAVELEISSGEHAGVYPAFPYQPGQWTDKMRFALEDEEIRMESGTIGSITIVLDSRQDVLSLPAYAIHTAEGKTFVYCMDENNMRELKWVETGFQGDDRVEILSGLEEGERVVLR